MSLNIPNFEFIFNILHRVMHMKKVEVVEKF